MHHSDGQRLNNCLGKASQLKTSRSTLASKGNTAVGEWKKIAGGRQEESKRVSHREKAQKFLSLLSPL